MAVRNPFPAIALSLVVICAGSANGQIDEICGDTGVTPWMNSSFVFGKIYLIGFDRAAKLPKITVTLSDRQGAESRYTVDRSGNYCFRGVRGGGGFLLVDMEGVEVGRQPLSAGGMAQYRQDFNVYNNVPVRTVRPAVVSAKYPYKRDEKNARSFEDALLAEHDGDNDRALLLYKKVVANDPSDFIAWDRLGGIELDRNDLDKAETAFMQALKANSEYAPSLIELGRLYMIRTKNADAIGLLLKATSSEPENPRAFRLLGEAYLLDKKGTLGVAALDEAIRLNPVGMAECHLLKARLYERVGANALASREYRLFLEKKPDHKDRKVFERFIKDHPEETPEKN